MLRRIRNYRIFFRLRMAWQRARYGYSEDQFYSLDHTLATMIVAGVAKMKEWNHGYPTEISNEEWLAILTKIEEGFLLFLDNDGWFTDDVSREKFTEAKALLNRWFEHLWD